MDKVNLNKFIVEMRSSIKTAKVHIVNKLVKKIRRLKGIKETDIQKEQNLRKAERFTNELVLIKKLNPDEISRYVLVQNEDPLQKLNKVSLDLNERVKLRFAIHKSVAKKVEDFRTQHPDWQLKLPVLIVQLGLRYKLKKKSAWERSLSTSQNEMTSVEESDMIGGSIDKSDDTDDDNDNETKNEDNYDKGESQNVDENTDKLNDIHGMHTIEIDSNKFESGLLNKTSIPEEKLPEKTKKVGGIAEIRKFTEIIDSEDNASDKDSVSVASEVHEDSLSAMTFSDSFFLTQNGSEIINNEDNNCSDSEVNTCKIFSSSYRSERINNKVTGRFNNHRDLEKRFSRRNREQWLQEEKNKKPTMNRKQRRMMERAAKASVSDKSHMKMYNTSIEANYLRNQIVQNRGQDNDKLHPSWEAKRKQKPQVVPFQGKKIVFDN